MTRPNLGGRSVNQAYREAVARLATALAAVDEIVADLYDVHDAYAQGTFNLLDPAAERGRGDTVHDRQLRRVYHHHPRTLDEGLEPARAWALEAQALLPDLPGPDFSSADPDGSDD